VGSAVNAAKVGQTVGEVVGASVILVGAAVGTEEGTGVGVAVGLAVASVGMLVGVNVVGTAEGAVDGAEEGAEEGVAEGTLVKVGFDEGTAEGLNVGKEVGLLVASYIPFVSSQFVGAGVLGMSIDFGCCADATLESSIGTDDGKLEGMLWDFLSDATLWRLDSTSPLKPGTIAGVSSSVLDHLSV
jgi:hypothetical protein